VRVRGRFHDRGGDVLEVAPGGFLGPGLDVTVGGAAAADLVHGMVVPGDSQGVHPVPAVRGDFGTELVDHHFEVRRVFFGVCDQRKQIRQAGPPHHLCRGRRGQALIDVHRTVRADQGTPGAADRRRAVPDRPDDGRDRLRVGSNVGQLRLDPLQPQGDLLRGILGVV
jgi:hypothetical protein